MKKELKLAVLIVIFLGSSNFINAQKERILTKGFSINFIFGFVPDNYAFVKDVPDPQRQLGILIGGQIGNRWYTKFGNKFAVGAMVNWFEIAVSSKKSSGEIEDLSDPVLDFVFFETGPIFTYALNRDTGLDAYYNLRPSILDGPNKGTFAISHATGVGIRWKTLSINFEYVFGKYPSGEYVNSEPKENEINHARLMLGFKF